MSGGILCVLQARMSSTRLPGKVLAPLLEQPLLARQIERLRRARCLDNLCVATSSENDDDPVADCCRGLDVDCYRGSLDDVLDRIYRAALRYQPEHVVRVTGDCPLLDPELLDAVVAQHIVEGNDYTSNAHVRTFPDGLDVEAIRLKALAQAWRSATSPHDREHVTPYLYRDGGEFLCAAHVDGTDRSALRWVVDYPRDLDFVRAVYAALYPSKPDFGRADIHALLAQRPALARINTREAEA